MTRIACTQVPATWQIASWPQDVWPFTPSKARTVLRFNRDELTRCGALVRPGQQLVVMGAPYLSWLQKKSDRVNDYDPSARLNARRAAEAAA